jgi:hypothetical protein
MPCSCRLLCRRWRQPLWCTTRRRAVTYPEYDVKEARPAVVRSYIMESGEEAQEALSSTGRQQRRAEGLLDTGGTRHGCIIYSGCAGGSLAYLTRLTLPSSRPINYQYAGLHARPPTPVLRPPSGQGGLKRSLGRRGVSATRFCAAPGGRAM